MSELSRCEWCLSDPQLLHYHDVEWGVPKSDDVSQFEHLVLETFQSGLSWLTILRKRENFRSAFAGFDPEKVAEFDDKDFDRLLNDTGIIRNRLKIESAVNNAKQFLTLTAEFGSFSKFLWQFTAQADTRESMEDIPSQTEQSQHLAKELKKRGFKFLGPTTCYAHMQSVGLVNDHVSSCFRYKEIEELRAGFKP